MMSESIYTVIGTYEETGQVFATCVGANTVTEAFGKAIQESDSPDTLQLISAIPGRHDVVTPCMDSGRACMACDFPVQLRLDMPDLHQFREPRLAFLEMLDMPMSEAYRQRLQGMQAYLDYIADTIEEQTGFTDQLLTETDEPGV